MAIAMAPFNEFDPGPMGPPRVVRQAPQGPASTDATECNYLIFFFIAGLFVMALTD